MDNREYWIKRSERRLKLGEADSAAATRRIKALYDSMMKQLRKEIEAFYGRYATAEGISMSDLRKLLTKSELSSFKDDLKEYAEIARQIQNGEASEYYSSRLKKLALRMNISRLESLQTEITSYVMQMGIKEEDILRETLASSYEDAYYRTAFDFQQESHRGEVVRTLDERTVNTVLHTNWAGDNYSGRIWRNKQKLISELETTFTRGVILNSDPDQLAREFAKNTGTSFRNSQRLVRTEIAYVKGQATQKMYKQYHVSKYQFVATLDLRTSEMCREMDGKIFDLKDAQIGINYPPLHAYCRSVTVPYREPDEIDALLPEGERAARDRQGRTIYVPASMTYNEWKAKYID